MDLENKAGNSTNTGSFSMKYTIITPWARIITKKKSDILIKLKIGMGRKLKFNPLDSFSVSVLVNQEVSLKIYYAFVMLLLQTFTMNMELNICKHNSVNNHILDD